MRKASLKHHNAAKASELIGAKVFNFEGQEIGKIEDVVADLYGGRIGYAVLSFGGILGIASKFFAVPWQALHYKPEEKKYTLNVEKKMLEQAPGFDKDRWPNFVDRAWGAGIYSYYGYDPYWDE